jgi:hypothetical protein
MEYQSLSRKFKCFLIEASGFYLFLIINIQSRFGLVDPFVIQELQLVWQDQPESMRIQFKMPLEETRPQLYLVVYRSLIYLGDLCRYKEVFADKKVKKWNLVRTFYKLANYLNPDNGNPLNQLAVVDTHAGQDFSAIGMYINRLPYLM